MSTTGRHAIELGTRSARVYYIALRKTPHTRKLIAQR